MKKNAKLEAIRKKTPVEVKLMIDHSFEIVDRIDQILTNKGLTQRDLAELMKKKESEVSKWMRGTHNFTLKTIAKLEAVLGESIFQISRKEATQNVIMMGHSVNSISIGVARQSNITLQGWYFAAESSKPALLDLAEQLN